MTCICHLGGSMHLHWCPYFDVERDGDNIPAGFGSASAWSRKSATDKRAWYRVAIASAVRP